MTFKKNPGLHCEHVLSVVLLLEEIKYSPAGHRVVFSVHDVTLFSLALKCVGGHGVHVLSAFEPPSVKYSPAGHEILVLGAHFLFCSVVHV